MDWEKECPGIISIMSLLSPGWTIGGTRWIGFELGSLIGRLVGGAIGAGIEVGCDLISGLEATSGGGIRGVPIGDTSPVFGWLSLGGGWPMGVRNPGGPWLGS